MSRREGVIKTVNDSLKINGSAIPQNHTRFLRLAEVKKITSLSKSAIYEKIANGEFPRQVALSRQTVVWVESEVFDWMNQRLSSRDKAETV
jgi:prophage regulatory protein